MHPKRCSSCPPPPPCKKRPVRRTCWQSPIWSTILAVLAGLAVVLLLLLLFSLLISNVDASEELVAEWAVFPSVPAVLPLVLLLQNADAAKGC